MLLKFKSKYFNKNLTLSTKNTYLYERHRLKDNLEGGG